MIRGMAVPFFGLPNALALKSIFVVFMSVDSGQLLEQCGILWTINMDVDHWAES